VDAQLKIFKPLAQIPQLKILIVKHKRKLWKEKGKKSEKHKRKLRIKLKILLKLKRKLRNCFFNLINRKVLN